MKLNSNLKRSLERGESHTYTHHRKRAYFKLGPTELKKINLQNSSNTAAN